MTEDHLEIFQQYNYYSTNKKLEWFQFITNLLSDQLTNNKITRIPKRMLITLSTGIWFNVQQYLVTTFKQNTSIVMIYIAAGLDLLEKNPLHLICFPFTKWCKVWKLQLPYLSFGLLLKNRHLLIPHCLFSRVLVTFITGRDNCVNRYACVDNYFSGRTISHYFPLMWSQIW